MSDYNSDFIDVVKKLDFTDKEIERLYAHIGEILEHDIWNGMSLQHHLDTRAVHSLQVCCRSWKKAIKNKSYDDKSVAIGALLHDFFFYDWHIEKINLDALSIDRKSRLPKMHGFMHPLIALDNAYKYFPHLMNEKVEDIIVKHMWPLTITRPCCKESWLVSVVDKKCSLSVFKAPKELPNYIGLKVRKRNKILHNDIN